MTMIMKMMVMIMIVLTMYYRKDLRSNDGRDNHDDNDNCGNDSDGFQNNKTAYDNDRDGDKDFLMITLVLMVYAPLY